MIDAHLAVCVCWYNPFDCQVRIIYSSKNSGGFDMRLRRYFLILVLVGAIPLVLLVSQPTGTGAENLQRPATVATVQVGPSNSFAFVPATQTIGVSNSVNWVWSSTTITHSTTSGSCPGGICTADGKWDSGQHSGAFNFNLQFNTPGRYPYFCSVHLSFMQGTIIVTTQIFLPLIVK